MTEGKTGTADETGLKPCPFCGGEADVENVVNGYYIAFCYECGVETTYCNDEEEAVTFWIRRVLTDGAIKAAAREIAARIKGETIDLCASCREDAARTSKTVRSIRKKRSHPSFVGTLREKYGSCRTLVPLTNVIPEGMAENGSIFIWRCDSLKEKEMLP